MIQVTNQQITRQNRFHWAEESVFYQIYPLGCCDAPKENNGEVVPRIRRLLDWVPHLVKLNAGAVYFCPIFQSDRHGYDTRDFYELDCRLGAKADFVAVTTALHEAGIKVVLDGVFNHVGRGFWAFQDVLQNRESSPYRDWFFVNFSGNSNYNDGLWYEGWEGHFELVKLNLKNPAVVDHILDAVSSWVRDYEIDGLRLDVAYSLDPDFLRRLRGHCLSIKPDFYLVGEMLHGDYNRLMNGEMLHSATNYECYKGLYSAFNSKNLFEIAHSLLRQFGSENWTLYQGKHLFNFVDNHDVSRIGSLLQNPKHLPLIYGLLYAMPGIPCLYYGSEWGITGTKQEGDDALRPAVAMPAEGELTLLLQKLGAIHSNEPALIKGDFSKRLLTNEQLIFERKFENDRILVAINIADNEFDAHFDAGAGRAMELLTGESHDFGGGSKLPPYSVSYWKVY